MIAALVLFCSSSVIVYFLYKSAKSIDDMTLKMREDSLRKEREQQEFKLKQRKAQMMYGRPQHILPRTSEKPTDIIE